ncbi:peptidoglycan/LPS O-acetylase OafA/YrhL [Antricoccus suffuscus]|uniref:Peptidoglycan/LPS O-acetylase OafA/YrhL n=1 Tax=Antricoccus suffuscus TaxID=1629062 RepID=A0A2T1A5M0_9ACTN|nr:acyltransferase [Antricoccus suffuscus]PRZ43903.1 peptidoglycan/LPS O-acetylase OafA/YrhL [Antricoccus suffuscus]
MTLAPTRGDRDTVAGASATHVDTDQSTLTKDQSTLDKGQSPGTNQSTPAKQKPRLHSLDLLRFIAALAVVLYHYTYAGHRFGSQDVDYPGWWNAVSRYGYLGVELFFLISGFVVFMSAWGRRPTTFAISRVTRLYPAYWLGILLTSAVVVMFGQGASDTLDPSHITWGRFATNLTMGQAYAKVEPIDGVYWTLACEVAFYLLVLALTYVGITRRSALAFMWGWLALSIVARVAHPRGDLGFWVDRILIPDWSYFFIAGMAFFLWRKFGRSANLAAVIVVSYVCAVFAEIRQAHFVTSITGSPVSPVVASLIVAIAFVLIWLIADGRLTKLSHPSFGTLGALTYPLYLLHAVIGYIIFNALDDVLNRWLLLGLVLGLMLASAWLITTYVERPLHPRLRDVLTKADVLVRRRLGSK